MRLYSETINDFDTLNALANPLGIETYNGRKLDDGALQFVLRPLNGSDKFRKGVDRGWGEGTRRVWAVSWAGHYVFMRRVFALDESAKFITGRLQKENIVYDGLSEFDSKAWDTGYIECGSMTYPEYPISQQAKNHEPWDTEQDLIEMAISHIPA